MSDITDLRDRMDRARAGDKERMRQEAYEELRDELRNALIFDPARIIQTPRWIGPKSTAALIIDESFDEKGGDASLRELLSIIGEAALHDSVNGLRALNWINARAEEHARFHADDLANQWQGYE